jgi:vacuolar protein sorting-associated protein 33A
MYWLESGPLSAIPTSSIVYLCRPKIKYVKIIAGPTLQHISRIFVSNLILDHIKRHSAESQRYAYTLLLVPRVSTLVQRILEEEGVLGEVNILPYNLQFIPIADDVVSLEMEHAFKEIWVVGPLLYVCSLEVAC